VSDLAEVIDRITMVLAVKMDLDASAMRSSSDLIVVSSKDVEILLTAAAREEAAEAKLAAITKQAPSTDDDALTLSNLEEDTNDVLDSLDKTLVKGAINWADLRCVSAEKVHDKRGREWFRVEIEEAAPGEEALIAAVAAGLTAKGWYMPDIEIATEW